MKKIFLLLLIAVFFSSCNKVSHWINFTYFTGTSQYPYKAAVIDPRISYENTNGYAKSFTIKFSDTCSDNVETYVKLNGFPYINLSESVWEIEVDSIEMSHGKDDTLLFDISYSGKSKRYGWDYSRRLFKEMNFSSRYSTRFLSFSGYRVYSVHFVNLSMDNDSILFSDQIFKNYSSGEAEWQVLDHSDIYFIPTGGNQLHFVVSWPEGQSFDNITLWYGNHLLNHISENGWQKRYYLDEFPLEEEMYLQIAQGDRVKRFPITVDFGEVQ